MKKNSATKANQATVFKFGTEDVRVIDRNREVWFVASDVARSLEYRDAYNMARNLDEDEKDTQIVSTLGGPQELFIINESGLYSAVLRSRKAEAKRFKKWVTSEVLPAIRKTGSYSSGAGVTLTPSEAVNLAGLLQLIPMFTEVQQHAEGMMRQAKSPMAAKMYDAWHETGLFAWVLKGVGERCRAIRDAEDRLLAH